MEATARAGKLVPQGVLPAGFNLNDLAIIQNAALLIRDLIDYGLLKTAVAWNQT
jgi:hypothetical protein